MSGQIYYSSKYYDEENEYRHVVLPKEMVKLFPKNHLMTEQEWRSIGVQQSEGWEHYMTHQPDFSAMHSGQNQTAIQPTATNHKPHILLFRRKKTPEKK